MALTDLTLTEVNCCECGKPISTIPSWLAGAKVNFQCEECRQKHPRVAGMAEIDPRRGLHAHDELGELDELHRGPAEEEEAEEETQEEEEYVE